MKKFILHYSVQLCYRAKLYITVTHLNWQQQRNGIVYAQAMTGVDVIATTDGALTMLLKINHCLMFDFLNTDLAMSLSTSKSIAYLSILEEGSLLCALRESFSHFYPPLKGFLVSLSSLESRVYGQKMPYYCKVH